jgi:hypothetical protein
MANNIVEGEHDWMYRQQGGVMGFPSPPTPAPQSGGGVLGKLGGLFGGGSYGGLLGEDEKKAAQRQALMAMASQLMAAGGPSQTRVSFGQALGPALMAGQQAYGETGKDALQMMLLKSKLQDSGQTTSQKDYKFAVANGFKGSFEEWKRSGTKASSGVQEYEYAKANGYKGTFEDWKRVASAQPQAPSAIQEYEYFNKLDPEQQKRFLSLQRSPVVPQVVSVNGIPTLVDRTTGQANPLSSLSSETDAARQMKEAEAAGRAQGDIAGTRASKSPVAYATYQAGVKSLEDAMAGTSTGPLVGRIPAMTAGQQIAEGAEAAMAPVLKELFRSAGEGTFTDADQALLMRMLPTRQDHEEARKAKIQMIDEIVKAKLGISADGAPGQAQSGPMGVGQATTINGVKVKRVK